MDLNLRISRSERELSIFKISVIILFLGGCSSVSKDINCEQVLPVVDIIVENLKSIEKVETDSVLVVNEYIKPNELYKDKINDLIDEGYKNLSCLKVGLNLKANGYSIVTGRSLNPTIFQNFRVIYLTQPLYNTTNKSVAIIATAHCGTDCGSVELYILKDTPEGWVIEVIETLAVM